MSIARINRRKVAIVGRAPSWIQCPFWDKSFEIWAMNDMFFLPRADRWFQIHDISTMDNAVCRDKRDINQIDRLKTLGIPIMMQKTHNDIPDSVEFPINLYLKKYRKVYTSTVCFMLAHAVEYADEMHLYGISALCCSEYSGQLDGIHYWIGVAEGKGIKVYIPEESNLLKYDYMYGYDNFVPDPVCPMLREKAIPIKVEVQYESIVSEKGIYKMKVKQDEAIQVKLQLEFLLKRNIPDKTRQMFTAFYEQLENHLDKSSQGDFILEFIPEGR